MSKLVKMSKFFYTFVKEDIAMRCNAHLNVDENRPIKIFPVSNSVIKFIADETIYEFGGLKNDPAVDFVSDTANINKFEIHIELYRGHISMLMELRRTVIDSIFTQKGEVCLCSRPFVVSGSDLKEFKIGTLIAHDYSLIILNRLTEGKVPEGSIDYLWYSILHNNMVKSAQKFIKLTQH